MCDTDVNTNLTTFSFSFPKLFMYHYQLLQDIQYLDKIIFILKTRPFFLIVYRQCLFCFKVLTFEFVQLRVQRDKNDL